MTADSTKFTKLIDHPEKQSIISKLVSGDSAKVVAQYLKDKYPKPDEGHLRIPATTLQEFMDTYANHHGYIKKIVQGNADSKLDKKIQESLMDNRTWRERIIGTAEKEFNYLEKLHSILTILEARTEQMFDMIQSDPESTRNDYIFNKHLEQLMMVIEKCDKIKNDRPDIRVEHHHYTVQMVEQQSFAFQEAIRRVLDRMGPEQTSVFMDLLKQEMGKINAKEINPLPPIQTQKELERDYASIDKLNSKVHDLDSEFEEDKQESTEQTQPEPEYDQEDSELEDSSEFE